MFFNNASLAVAIKFFWWGMMFGLLHVFCQAIYKVFHYNKFVYNFVSFCYWLMFGAMFSFLCIKLNAHEVCFYGLASMFAGMCVIKISINFVLTFLFKLIYSRFARVRRKKDGELQTN